jgi:lipopolysaccharide/colanic/teichoic acid biosynthesis glycosyltransferase
MGPIVNTKEAAGFLALQESPEREKSQLVEHLARSTYLRVKHVLEFCFAAVLLLLTAPLIFLCALLVKLTSRGPAIYSQVRLGLGGRPYRIYKLRTMYHQCEKKSGARWSQAGDPRVTRLGRFLRSSHLDELPQLWNILKGEMSLVGPRPERPEFIPALARAIPLYELRLLVRPGVTGLAQIQLPPDTDVESVRLKLAHDLYYVRHMNLWVDLRIIFATVFKVFGASFHFLRQRFLMPARALVESNYAELQQSMPEESTRLQPGLLPNS